MGENAENPPAFPVSSIDGFTQHGMTLRDYFAGQALQGFQRSEFPRGMDNDELCASVARGAYALADAMLAARNA